MFDLSISLINNDYQINKCTKILQVDERLCYVLPILSIPYFTISSYNRVILSINFFSYDFVTIKWMDSSARIRRVRIAVCDSFLPSCESIFKMVRSMRIIL